MIDSKGSVVISEERALDGLAGSVVVPDGGGQCEDALQDADYHAFCGVAAVLLEVELAFEGVVDRLDDLAQRLEEPGACPFGVAFAGGPQERDPRARPGRLEGGAEVVLVADEGLARPGRGQVRAGGEHAGQHLALVGFRAGQGERDGQSLQGAHQVQAKAPEVAGVAGAVPVFGPSGQVRVPGGLAGAAALDRGGIHHPYVVGPYGGIGGQCPDAVPDHRCGGAQPLAVTGLLGQVREQVPQVRAGVPQPPGLGGEPRQGLQDRQGDQLSIAQFQAGADLGPPRPELRRFLQHVVRPDVQCGSEGVQVGVHEGLRVRRWVSNADPGHLLCSPRCDTPCQTPWNWSSSAARRRHRPAPRYPRAALDPGTGTGTTDQPEHWRDTGKLRASLSAPGLLARVYKCVTLPKSTGSKTG